MSKRREELYQRILELRAKRLGVSPHEAERVDRSKPLFLIAAEAAAERLGVSPEEVLDADLKRMDSSTYPTPECLTPDDVEDLVEADLEFGAAVAFSQLPLSKAQLSHLESCDGCQTLVAACRPQRSRRDEFERVLDVELSRQSEVRGIREFVGQVMIDHEFLRHLERDPDGVLASYDLTSDERAAIIKVLTKGAATTSDVILQGALSALRETARTA